MDQIGGGNLLDIFTRAIKRADLISEAIPENWYSGLGANVRYELTMNSDMADAKKADVEQALNTCMRRLEECLTYVGYDLKAIATLIEAANATIKKPGGPSYRI